MATADFGFTREREDARGVARHLNPLPRSVTSGNTYELLDGEWDFALDLEDRGLRERWYLGHTYTDRALWPGTIEAHLAAGQDAQRHTPPWQDTVVAWYERTFAVPETWTHAPGVVVQVTFGAVAYETRVWLNGHNLRTIEGEETHVGAYTSFSYELPPEHLRPGPGPANRLTVRVAASMDAEIPRGKQESRVYKRGGIWYQTISGPVRSVWIEPVQRNRLRTHLGVMSQIEDRLVEFALTTRVRDPGAYTLRLVVSGDDKERPLAVSEFKLPLEAGEKRQRVAVELPEAALWSPAEPTLYHLVAQLVDPRDGVSQIEARIGLRKVEARDRFVYLNNRAIYLDGILYQPAAATYEEVRRHMLAIKALGCNLVRVHIAGIDPRVYDLADELGLLLWIEVPSPHSSTERSRANHRAELERLLVMAGGHPSVVCLSLYNEDWGAQDIATSAETRAYIARTYDEVRLRHPELLVVGNDGWHHTCVEGRLSSDLLTAHLYTPDQEAWRELLDRLVAGETEDVAAQPLVVGDPFFYRGQVPLVVSEWGGFGFPMYGGPTAEDRAERAARIRAFKRELRLRPIAGDVYTQAVSIEDEVNGLIDPQSGDLLVPPGLLGSSKAPREPGAP